MKKLITKYKAEWIGSLPGAVAGWMYWYFIGCASGSCAITSNPLNSTIYGAAMGALIPGMFTDKTKKEKVNHENTTKEQEP